MVITNKKAKPTFSLHIDQNVIKQSNCVKYVGVLIDSSLNWKPQIQKACSKLASACWALYQLRKYVDYKTLVMVCNSTLHSHLMYCISSWGSASNSNMRPLFLLQKRAMRIITHSNKRTRTTPLFSRLQILKLHDVCKLEIAKLMDKVHNKALNICNALTNNYTLLDNIHSQNTRRKHQKNYFMTRLSSKQA